jgi:hypothetical protein
LAALFRAKNRPQEEEGYIKNDMLFNDPPPYYYPLFEGKSLPSFAKMPLRPGPGAGSFRKNLLSVHTCI